MVPIILVTQDPKYVDTYVDGKVQKHVLPSSSIFRVKPEKTSIAIDQIREVASLAQNAHAPQLIVIYEFHTAKPAAQNALLKTLEEGSSHTHFVLVVNNEAEVLPTIRSRSMVSHSDDEYKPGTRYLDKYGLLDTVSSVPQWMSVTTKLSKEQSLALVDELIGKLSESLDSSKAKVLSELLVLRSLMHKNNINHEYALDEAGTLLHAHDLLPLQD